MPRNGSGTYTLPQPPFVPNTVISSSSVNSDLSDIAAALTQSVSADGQTPITGQLKSSLTATPGFTSTSDSTTGFGVSTAGEADIYASGSKIVSVTSGTVSITNNLNVTGSLTAASTNFAGTGAVGLPAGTTGQRPGSPITGQTRFNTTDNNLETYDGTEWQSASGFTTAYTITASVGSSLLTVNILNALTGSAPTVADPLAIKFRDVTLATGDQTTVLVNSALTINTNAAGATLGTTSGVPFRFWIVAFNNAGTVVLGLINCSTSTQIFPLSEAILQSSTAISAAATSAGTFYTPNGTTISSKTFKILGYLDYSAGLGTAGTYNTGPTTLQIFNSSIKTPGAMVQSVYNITTATASTTNTSGSPSLYLAATIIPTNTINPIFAQQNGNGQVANTGNSLAAQIYRGSTSIGVLNTVGGAANVGFSTTNAVYDLPNTSSSTVYSVKFYSLNGGGVTFINDTLIMTELMG